MRLILICSSLEPGRDGVGDYSRRLAAALISLGAVVEIVALHDRHRSGMLPVRPEEQVSEGQRMSVWRYPAAVSWAKRMRRLQTTLAEFRPDWVSLQFVPYGFQDKGLPWFLPNRLARLRGNFRWQILFHELWIGETLGYTLPQRGVGFFQKRIAWSLAKDLRAACHTTNAEYLRLLRSNKVSARLLPLFSNIPLASADAALREAVLEKNSSSKVWIFVFFATIYARWEPEPLLARIEKARQFCGIARCVFLSIGRVGAAGKAIWDSMRSHQNPAFDYVMNGEFPPERISQYLQIADFGVSTSPLSILGKSGSVAAMREHGVPVIVTQLDTLPPPDEDFIIPLDDTFEHRLATAKKLPLLPGSGNVAEHLLSELRSL